MVVEHENYIKKWPAKQKAMNRCTGRCGTVPLPELCLHIGHSRYHEITELRFPHTQYTI